MASRELDEFAALAHYRSLAWRLEELLAKAGRALAAVEELVEAEELDELRRSLIGDQFEGGDVPVEIDAKTHGLLARLDAIGEHTSRDLQDARGAAGELFTTLEDELQRRRAALSRGLEQRSRPRSVTPLRRSD